jgi:HTH-type transcriptional regulator / antitoxin HipB
MLIYPWRIPILIKNIQDIAQLVKTERKAQGLTQMKLAQLCNVGTRFIIDLEKGKPTCEIGKVLIVLHGLGIKLRHD